MNALDNIIQDYDNKLRPKLEETNKKIIESIKKHLENCCKNSGQIQKNSVYPNLFPFMIESRVKSSVSLKEKIVRKGLFKMLSESEKISDEIQNIFDDLIGVTILVDTSFKIDSFANFIFKLKEFSNDFTITTKDINNTKKKLGSLKYYNIKVEYKDDTGSYKIEIQIKSNIVFSFANLQHKLIYKNNSILMSKKAIDLMIKSVTPAILAIEGVINDAEELLKNSEIDKNEYKNKEIIQNWLGKISGAEKEILYSYIDDIYVVFNFVAKGNKKNIWEVIDSSEVNLDLLALLNSHDYLWYLLTQLDKELLKDYLIGIFVEKNGKNSSLDTTPQYYIDAFDEIVNQISSGDINFSESKIKLYSGNAGEKSLNNFVKVSVNLDDTIGKLKDDLDNMEFEEESFATFLQRLWLIGFRRYFEIESFQNEDEYLINNEDPLIECQDLIMSLLDQFKGE